MELITSKELRNQAGRIGVGVGSSPLRPMDYINQAADTIEALERDKAELVNFLGYLMSNSALLDHDVPESDKIEAMFIKHTPSRLTEDKE